MTTWKGIVFLNTKNGRKNISVPLGIRTVYPRMIGVFFM
jgi:hypothetical protein